MGLEFYVSKAIIENNGGKIWAESDGEDKSIRLSFVIDLPIVSDDVDKMKEKASE